MPMVISEDELAGAIDEAMRAGAEDGNAIAMALMEKGISGYRSPEAEEPEEPEEPNLGKMPLSEARGFAVKLALGEKPEEEVAEGKPKKKAEENPGEEKKKKRAAPSPWA